MREVVIIDAIRTPIGKYGGVLSLVRPDDMVALLLKKIVERNNLDPNLIDDVYIGCSNQAGEDNRNVARMAIILAGFPVSVPGATINRLCGSGLEAISIAASMIRSGIGDIYIAGGVESMSRAPFVIPKSIRPFQRELQIYDTTIGWRFVNPKWPKEYPPISMGETAENLAELYKISREEQDLFAYNSHMKAVKAQKEGKFKDEIIPVEVFDEKTKNTNIVDKDENPRPDTSLEKLAKLKPVFRPNGTVTAGNSSGINDGASVVLLMSREKAEELGYKPILKIISWATAGVNPNIMGIGPVPATRKLLKKVGLELKDIDLIEINEAFAAQVLACLKEFEIDPNDPRLNPNGGAIALGHPLGCSGARITTTLFHEAKRRNVRYCLATMCIGVGQGISMLFEKL
ncbi:MAG: acetyl-CoA C-acyltransferase [Thermoproteota archaeon]|jgi:3-oxoadipyl-CoA thiolase|nr:acetyl-CoA C-acyltransferase [Thermoproteota archaeon]